MRVQNTNMVHRILVPELVETSWLLHAIAIAQDGDLLIAWNELSEAGKAIKFKKVKCGAIVVKESKP
jgi:hypothetical protein